MVTLRRIAFCVLGTAGLLLVFVLGSYHYSTLSCWYWGGDYLQAVTVGWPGGTAAAYIVSFISSYLLAEGVIGGKIFGRRWRLCLATAFTLAGLLVGGMILYRFLCPEMTEADWRADLARGTSRSLPDDR